VKQQNFRTLIAQLKRHPFICAFVGPLIGYDLSVPPQDPPAPPAPTPESGAQSGPGELTRRLVAAYHETFEAAEGLPAVVWVRWGEKDLLRFLRVPYMRWFLRYFLARHVHKGLSTLDRRLHAIAALSGDPDANKADQEAVQRYLRSLPPPPYKRLAVAILFAALLVALPLRSVGDASHVLVLVGALMKLDIASAAKAFTAEEFWRTVRAMLVLLLALSVVTSLLNSTFVLKRMLFNLYPAAKERLRSTAARDQAFRVEGLYALEDRVFGGFGLRRPKEIPFDLLFRAYVVVPLLLLSVVFGFLAIFGALLAGGPVQALITEAGGTIEVDREGIWIVALLAIIFFFAFVARLIRLLVAWRRRNRPVSNRPS
jgi:hypothetical protein